MTWEFKDGLYLKDGCYLSPITSRQIDEDSYRLANMILQDNLEAYKKRPPLLLPLMRGGSRPFLNISGAIRRMLNPADVDYIPIKVSRYVVSMMNKEGQVLPDAQDLGQAMYAMEDHDVGLIIDDVFDRGITCERIKHSLEKNNKKIQVATVYRKAEHNKSGIEPDYFVQNFDSKEIDGVKHPCWLVFPWEIDDHEPELWAKLYPEFAQLHPEVALR